MGKITRLRIGVPPKTGKIKKKRRITPNLFKKRSTPRAFWGGRSPIRILPPSKGWIGIRLKTAKEILRRMKGEIKGRKLNLKIIDKSVASIKLAPGPAKEMMAESLWGFLRLYGSNCTGLAQPNGKGKKPLTVRKAVAKRRVVPTGS